MKKTYVFKKNIDQSYPTESKIVTETKFYWVGCLSSISPLVLDKD